VSAVIDWPDDDDEALLAGLGAAQAEAASVPAEFLAAARGALAWRTVEIDLAIAELTFDSARDAELATRSSGGPIRLLAFGTRDVTLEFEVTAAGIAGQLTPVSVGRVTCQTAAGDFDDVPVDAVGCFLLRAPASGPVRLRARTQDYTVATSWVCLG
jgi:hypothetical protein